MVQTTRRDASMAADETSALLIDPSQGCGRLDRGQSGVLARVLYGRRSNFVDGLLFASA